MNSVMALNTLFKTTVEAALTELHAGLTSAYQEFTPDEKRILLLKTDWLMFELSDTTIQVIFTTFVYTVMACVATVLNSQNKREKKKQIKRDRLLKITEKPITEKHWNVFHVSWCFCCP